MLIAILILLCFLIFMSIFIYGGLILIRKELQRKRRNLLPIVKPEILRTLAGEIERIKKMDAQAKEGRRWTEEFFSEQPCLMKYLEVEASKTGEFDVGKVIPAFTVYRLLKAQAEADSLADLTKIQK